jgi:hypothetical protein
VLTLNEGALGQANMFDLNHRTLRFSPDSGGYRVENVTLRWDPEFGAELTAPRVSLHNFTFPFSGKTWDSFTAGANGSIAFTAESGGGGGVPIGRFDQLQEAARTLLSSTPAICVFTKPRMSGHRYAKETADGILVTWDVTEPYGGIQDFTWMPKINRFQTVLRRDGSIEMSYDQMAARDAIVGVYPLIPTSQERLLETLAGEGSIANVKLSTVGGTFLKVRVETRGPILPANDPRAAGLQYKVTFGLKPEIVWTVRAFARGGRGGGGARYVASGSGVAPAVQTDGNTLSFQGTLGSATKVSVSAEVLAAGNSIGRVVATNVAITGIHSPAVHLSSLKHGDGPFPAVYESFHYLSLPNYRDLTCSVIQALGDKFDMLAYYSDFRVDNQEAGTPSNGPLGSTGEAVTGIGATQRGLDGYCSAGRFQWQFIQPVYVGSNQMQERPPA